MNKTKIGWCDYTWNPIKGLCPQSCPYCYARRMYKRFKWNPKVRLDTKELLSPLSKSKSHRKIFVCSTIDILHREIPDGWIYDVLNIARSCIKDTFLFLTKNPLRYADFLIRGDIPSNCWLGRTQTQGIARKIVGYDPNRIHFVSCEPLLGLIEIDKMQPPDWIIIGGLTPKPIHKKEWVDDIIKQARELKIPIFLKNNLHYPKKIQEFPKEIK